MLKVTLRGIRQHLVRFLLTAFAVTLGVALVAGTFVLTDSIDKTFDRLITQGTEGVDVTVRGAQGVGDANGGLGDTRVGLPLTLQGRLQQIQGVKRVSPDLQGSAVLVGKDGTPVRNGGAPTLGFAFAADDPVVHLIAGRGPATSSEVAVEKTTLEKSGLRVGQRTNALIGGTPGPVTVVGEVDFDAALAGATMVLVDPGTARREWAADGTVASFSLTAQPGVSPQQLKATVHAALPAVQVVTSTQVADETRKEIDKALGFITYFLLVFALVSLFVGGFIIANTFSMLVAQRTRELALLRALGASRGQVLRVVLGEAFVLGLVGSAAGLGFGLVLAKGLQALFGSFGLEISGGLPVLPRTVVASFAVGIGVTVLSAILPGIRASRVAPVAALRDDVALPVGGVRRRGLIGGVVLAAGVAIVVPSVLADKVTWALVGLGAALLVIGALVAAPITTRPVVRVIAKPFTLRGVVGRLARENALRNPRRTATTASALMIGLALMGGVSVLAASTKASVKDLVSTQLKADYVLNGGQAAFPPTVATAVGRLPDVAQVATIGFVNSTLGRATATGIAADPAALLATVKMDVTAGTLASTSPNDIFVSRTTAKELHYRVGQTLPAEIGTLKRDVTIRAIFADNQVLNNPQVIFTRALYTKATPVAQQGDYYVYVKAKPGVDDAALRSRLVATVRPFIVVSVQDAGEFTDSQADQVNQILALLYGLLGLSVVIAILGIVNTLALSVFERTREIGLLRAVGLTRPQLRRMITVESVSTAVFGAVLGLALGLAFGLIVQRGLRSQGLESLAVPWGQLLGVLVAAAIAGVVAAVLPAWRATRLDVLRAITTD